MKVCKKCNIEFADYNILCTKCGSLLSKGTAHTINPGGAFNRYDTFVSPIVFGGTKYAITDRSLVIGDRAYTYDKIGRIVMRTESSVGKITCTMADVETPDGSKQLKIDHMDRFRFIVSATFANTKTSPRSTTELLKDAYMCEVYLKKALIDFKNTFVILQPSSTYKNYANAKDASTPDGQFVPKNIEQMLSDFALVTSHLDCVYGDIPDYPRAYQNIDDLKLIIDIFLENPSSIPLAVSEYESRYCKRKHDLDVTIPDVPMVSDWIPIQPKSRSFKICGHMMTVPETMDFHNDIRNQFYDIASQCAFRAEQMFRSTVHDIDTFFQNAVNIYEDNIKPIVELSTNALISMGIWDVDSNDLKTLQHSMNNRFLSCYHTVKTAYDGIISRNKEMTSTVFSYIPRRVGTITSTLSGAIQGAFETAASNIARDVFETTVIDATTISEDQKLQLYKLVDIEQIVNAIRLDYLYYYLVVVHVVREHGQSIWYPDDQQREMQMKILRNLDNPSFPQVQKIPAIMDCILKYPYNGSVYKELGSLASDKDEVDTIADYFRVSY